MRETKAVKIGRFFDRMRDLGFSWDEANKLRLIEMTLSRWSEAECNGDIQRDETTGVAYRHYGHGTSGPFLTTKVADRESGALARAGKILSAHPELWLYHQGDPRGCSLYVGRKSDVNGHSLDSVYSRGVAVCI